MENFVIKGVLVTAETNPKSLHPKSAYGHTIKHQMFDLV